MIADMLKMLDTENFCVHSAHRLLKIRGNIGCRYFWVLILKIPSAYL